MNLVIREARDADWPAVALLLAQLGRPDVQLAAQDHRDRFRSYLSRADTVALVAERGEKIVGFIDIEYRQRLNFNRPQAWIPDLIVAKDKRGFGIGSALLREAERLARDRGCWGIALESANWRTDAHLFYKSLDWEQSAKAFTKSFTGEALHRPPLQDDR